MPMEWNLFLQVNEGANKPQNLDQINGKEEEEQRNPKMTKETLA